jgi:hypothetical protein
MFRLCRVLVGGFGRLVVDDQLAPGVPLACVYADDDELA